MPGGTNCFYNADLYRILKNAFGTALMNEKLAGGIHFQQFMENDAGSHRAELFEKIDAYDRDHERRMRMYMEAYGIQISEIEC